MFESLASILLLAFVIAIFIAFTKNGTNGVGEWLNKKFVGE